MLLKDDLKSINMKYKFIGMKEFRQNLATYTAQSKRENIKYIILKKNVPVLEVSPLDEKKFALEKLTTELDAAEKEIAHGKFYTQDEVMREFGLS